MTETVMKLRNENKHIEAGEKQEELEQLENTKKWCDVHYKGGRKTRRKKKRKSSKRKSRRKNQRKENHEKEADVEEGKVFR